MNKKRVLICYCLRGRPWIRLEINQKKDGSWSFYTGVKSKKTPVDWGRGIRMGLGNKNRVVISYCFRGRPWIRLEIKKMALGRIVFIQGLNPP